MSARPFADLLQDGWRRRGPLAIALLPITGMYWLLTMLRRAVYALGLREPEHVPPVVLVVGNVVAGGAGKTPVALRIVQHLQAQQIAVGVISRGYGRTTVPPCIVSSQSSSDEVGDEPLLIYKSTGAPTAVAAKRAEAARLLVSAHPELKVLVCDDGLQHYALHRDVEVCVLDDRGTGNGWLLPSGPLREPWPLHPLTAVGQSPDGPIYLWASQASGDSPTPPVRFPTGAVSYPVVRTLAKQARARNGETTALESVAIASRPLAAVAGIARPEVFFNMLRQGGIPLSLTLALPDHAIFDSLTLAPLAGHTVLCTEKDAAKLWPLVPDALAVPLHLDIGDAFFTTLDQRVQGALRAKLSFAHGHTTT